MHQVKHRRALNQRRAFTLGALLALAALGLGASFSPAAVTSTGTTTPQPAAIEPAGPAIPQPKKQKLTPTRLTALPPSTITNATAPLRIRFSGPPAPNSPAPTLTPSVAGKWSTAGDFQYFTPVSTLEPCSSYQLTIWARSVAVGHAILGQRRTIGLRIACPPTDALQQALARLGYLPYTFHSSHGVHLPSGAESRSLAARHAYRPPAGHLVASFGGVPALQYGVMDATTRGAVMVYQAAHGLEMSGAAELHTWASLLAAETSNSRDRVPYTYVTVSESSPETLEVHRGSHVALSSPANTGVAGAETATGTFPIFARYTSTTMSGTNPDGTKYKDPGVPWVNYFNGGDAVHGFPRPSYGSPQSNGCVELPISTAQEVYAMLQIGDIVIVRG
ncbi:MAG TPA: L,D-transpeptidase [Solirubrobacteraceae bacterium]